jgi:hypothetical protein
VARLGADGSKPSDSTDSSPGSTSEDAGSGHTDSSGDDSASRTKTKGGNSEVSSSAKNYAGAMTLPRRQMTALSVRGHRQIHRELATSAHSLSRAWSPEDHLARARIRTTSVRRGTRRAETQGAGEGNSYNGDPPRPLVGSPSGCAAPEDGSTDGGGPPSRHNYSPDARNTPPIARRSQDGQGTEEALPNAVPDEVICYQRVSSKQYRARLFEPRRSSAAWCRVLRPG